MVPKPREGMRSTLPSTSAMPVPHSRPPSKPHPPGRAASPGSQAPHRSRSPRATPRLRVIGGRERRWERRAARLAGAAPHGVLHNWGACYECGGAISQDPSNPPATAILACACASNACMHLHPPPPPTVAVKDEALGLVYEGQLVRVRSLALCVRGCRRVGARAHAWRRMQAPRACVEAHSSCRHLSSSHCRTPGQCVHPCSDQPCTHALTSPCRRLCASGRP